MVELKDKKRLIFFVFKKSLLIFGVIKESFLFLKNTFLLTALIIIY